MTGEEPLYLQLRNQIVLGIGTGELALGERLPTIRQLAQDTGINAMTINKAYSLLKSEGYIEIDRRHGAKVSLSLAADNGSLSENNFSSRQEAQLQLLITESALAGVGKRQLLALCEQFYDSLNICRITPTESSMGGENL